MRSYKFRTIETVTKECLYEFPDGNLSRHNDKKINPGLFLWMDRNMGGFRRAFKTIYGREYLDKRTLRTTHNWGVSKPGKLNPNYGNKMSKESKQKISIANTKHGKSPELLKIRNSYEGIAWRKQIFCRDNYTCQLTKQVGGAIIAHHIASFNNNPKLRFNINNGITMKKDVHVLFHKIFGKGNNTVVQLNSFINKFDCRWL